MYRTYFCVPQRSWTVEKAIFWFDLNNNPLNLIRLDNNPAINQE